MLRPSRARDEKLLGRWEEEAGMRLGTQVPLMRHRLGLGGGGGAEPPLAPPTYSRRPFRSQSPCRENGLCSPGGRSSSSAVHLVAQEGCRMHRAALATFASVALQDYADTCLAYLPVPVFSVPGLQPQVNYSCS